MLWNTSTRIQFESGLVDMRDAVFGWTHSPAHWRRSSIFNICRSTWVWKKKAAVTWRCGSERKQLWVKSSSESRRSRLTGAEAFLCFCQTDFGCTNCLDSSLPAFVPVFCFANESKLSDWLLERADGWLVNSVFLNANYRLAPHAFHYTCKGSILCCQNIFGCVRQLEVEIQETLNPTRSSPAAWFFLNLLFNEAVNQFVKGWGKSVYSLASMSEWEESF